MARIGLVFLVPDIEVFDLLARGENSASPLLWGRASLLFYGDTFKIRLFYWLRP